MRIGKVLGIVAAAVLAASPLAAYDMQTSKTNHIVQVGTVPAFSQPFFVTSFGQSTDAAMLQTVMKRIKASYVYEPTATAEDLDGAGTVVIAVGASSKGLGAAGISESDERSRAEKVMAKLKQDGTPVIFVHIGGQTRRGAFSDELAKMVMDQASYLVVKEDANWDGMFTDYAAASGKPLTLIFATRDTIQVFQNLL